MSYNKLPKDYRPSVQDANWFNEYWKELSNYSNQEKALDKLFMKLCPENKTLEDILIKCSTLNDFYSTNIFDIHSLAEHILNLNIDERLRQIDYSLVNDIAFVKINFKTHNFYSFATKYCNHHLPEDYAIYDKYVEKILVSMNQRDHFSNFKKEDLKDYKTYMSVIKSFRHHYGLSQFTIKQLDRYLWQLGKWYFNPYGLIYKYYNREDVSPFPQNDIKSNFWWGEMMFVKGHLSVGKWKELGEKCLLNADNKTKKLAERYTPEQFGLILYINELFAKWCPYDNLEWIFEY